jgi:hypothetical protein
MAKNMVKQNKELQMNSKVGKDTYNYCIPSPMAKFMSLIDDRTQMEASMMSMLLLLIGMIIFLAYVAIYSGWNLWSKIMTIFNGLCGILLIFSGLVTTFQQYQSLRETQDIVGNFGTTDPFPVENPKEELKDKPKIKIIKKEVKI